LVPGFDGDDGAGGSEDGGLFDEGSSAEVSIKGCMSARYPRFTMELRSTYALIPTASRTRAVATMVAASVKPKLYVQGCTGVPPAAEIAIDSCVTWVLSVAATIFRLLTSSVVRPRAVKSEAGNIARPWL
jgi:hypothetical protein